MEKRSGQNHFDRKGKDLSGSRAPDSKLASLELLEATLLSGPCKKGCVMKKTEMSAQATGHVSHLTARTTGRPAWSKNHREKHKQEATSADPSSRNTALMFRAESVVDVPYTEGL